MSIWSAVLCCQAVCRCCKTSSAARTVQPNISLQSQARPDQGMQPTAGLPTYQTAGPQTHLTVGPLTHQNSGLPTQSTAGLSAYQTAEQPIQPTPALPMHQSGVLQTHLSSYPPTETMVGFPGQQMQLSSGIEQHPGQHHHASCKYGFQCYTQEW